MALKYTYLAKGAICHVFLKFAKKKKIHFNIKILLKFKAGPHIGRHPKVPERRLRGGAGSRHRARQLPQGPGRGDLPDKAGRTTALEASLLVAAQDLDGRRGATRQPHQEELQSRKFVGGRKPRYGALRHRG